MFFFIACTAPEHKLNSDTAAEHRPYSETQDTSTDTGAPANTEIRTSLTTAWVEGADILTTNDENVVAAYYLSSPTQRSDSDGEPNGYTPEKIALAPGVSCVRFKLEPQEGVYYVSATICEDIQTTGILTTPLCMDMAGDWICEDLWGEGTPETYYVNRDVEMENGCEVAMIGVTWGGQRALVTGNLLFFTLGNYTATGVIAQDGLSMTFKVDYELDYWSTCQKLY